jgi:hypothetical protein
MANADSVDLCRYSPQEAGNDFGQGVIDLRSNFREHGQLSVALSRVTDAVNLCFLLLGSSDLR